MGRKHTHQDAKCEPEPGNRLRFASQHAEESLDMVQLPEMSQLIRHVLRRGDEMS